MKKLKIIATFLLVLFWIMNIVFLYMVNYPLEFDLSLISREFKLNWFSHFKVFISTLIIASIVSFVPFKSIRYSAKFYFFIIVMISGLIGIMLFNGVKKLLDNKEEFEILRNEFIKDALNDIKNDSVKTFSYGFPLAPLNNKNYFSRLDSVYKKYGLYNKNLGCMVNDPVLTKVQQEYEEITNPYLEKRNGTAWRGKMEKELDSIK